MPDPQRYVTPEEALARLTREDAVGQLLRRAGAMARLGSEDGALKLDWVDMVPRLLSAPALLKQVEEGAQELVARGGRHIIWAGMGGSVLAVRALKALGFAGDPVTLHPLDSTDPAALNAILADLDDLERATMIAVALGMTSEEPISHLEWFASALRARGLDPTTRQLVMALPGSYLERYAQEQSLASVSLQLDGGAGINGRMSAPGTRVFLLPTALWLAGQGAPPGALVQLMRVAWEAAALPISAGQTPASQWGNLAAALASAADAGVVRMSMETPAGWESLRDWAEQLMEESLGKGGQGVVVFAPEALPLGAPASLRVRVTASGSEQAGLRDGEFIIVEPLIGSRDAEARLAGLAALFLGLQWTMALYGYLWDIPFAGQPAVEAYKSRARALRDSKTVEIARPVSDGARLRVGQMALAEPEGGFLASATDDPPSALAIWLRGWRETRPLAYLDLTINGEVDAAALAALEESLRRLAVGQLGMGYKLRRAPAAYHSTEQSEMDGPEGVVSLRALSQRHATVSLGDYSPRFLEAQAVATWQAMNAQGRLTLLSLYDGVMSEMVVALTALLDAVAAEIAGK